MYVYTYIQESEEVPQDCIHIHTYIHTYIHMQESEEVPQDFTTLFDETLFKFDTDIIPEAVKLYDTLDVKHEMLTLIPPQV